MAGAGNVTKGAGLRPKAKALDEPPDPTVGAPIPDPTDVAGAGNVTRGTGLRPTAKALDEPPDPTVGAPIPDPTWEGVGVRFPHATRRIPLNFSKD